MDQQQRGGTGELGTLTDVLTGQGVGAGAPWGVCLHVDIFDRTPLVSLPGEGRSALMAAKVDAWRGAYHA